MKFTILIIILLLTACKKEVKFVGYPNIEKIHNQIKFGYTKEYILNTIGAPSFISNDESIWYYTRINGNDGNLVSFVPKNRSLLAITFNGQNLVADIKIDTKEISLDKKPYFINKKMLKYSIK